MKLPKTLEKLKLDPRVTDVYAEDNDMDGDGKIDYWVHLATGYANYGVEPNGGLHMIHETSVRYIASLMKSVDVCHCKDCENERRIAGAFGIRTPEQVFASV